MSGVVNDRWRAEIIGDLKATAQDRRLWVILLCVAMILGLTGPFGTYGSMALPMRLIYWSVIVVTTYWIAISTQLAIMVLAEAQGAGPRVALALGSLATSVPVSLWLAVIHVAVFGAAFWTDALRLFPYVLVITVALSVLVEALERVERALPAPPTDAQPLDWPAFLPDDLGRDLILLQAQDHYLRVETAKGEALIRARLQDAAEALAGHGVRVHRSWWVARDAVVALKWKNAAPVVVLKTGQEVPVGRTYRRSARRALTKGTP